MAHGVSGRNPKRLGYARESIGWFDRVRHRWQAVDGHILSAGGEIDDDDVLSQGGVGFASDLVRTVVMAMEAREEDDQQAVFERTGAVIGGSSVLRGS